MTRPEPDPRLIGDALEHWARVTPDAEALIFGDRNWTWAQWHDRVRRTAGALRERGVRRGDVVAFVDKNHVACLDVTHAAARLGAATAIVSWRLSVEELTYVLGDCGARLVFVGAELMAPVAEALKGLDGARDVVVVGHAPDEPDEFEALLAGAAPLPERAVADPSDPVLVLYTSGTTGFPKGALLTHDNFAACRRAGSLMLEAGPGNRNLVALPLFHVGGSTYAQLGIHAGMPTILSRDATPPSLFPALARGATHTFLVPALIAAILEAGDAAVAPGEPGELWWRSAQVMAGYLGRPEATAEIITSAGWLRSGDVGYVDDGGFVFICDRVKDMIITGGENVYCPEVERVLVEHPAVGEAAVIGVPDERWGECVKAVVAPAPGAAVVEADLVAYCRERLAHYKCPTSVDVVDALPRNATGKVLKRDLRAPYWAGRDRQV